MLCLQEKNDVPINVLRRISCLCLAATKFDTIIVTDELWSTVLILHGTVKFLIFLKNKMGLIFTT